jgi:hypothetical protein
VDEWLARYGHRAPGEFDLAAPRWRERAAELLAMAARLKGGADPLELHRAHVVRSEDRAAAVRGRLSRACPITWRSVIGGGGEAALAPQFPMEHGRLSRAPASL